MPEEKKIVVPGQILIPCDYTFPQVLYRHLYCHLYFFDESFSSQRHVINHKIRAIIWALAEISALHTRTGSLQMMVAQN
jgi:hypothetical protein